METVLVGEQVRATEVTPEQAGRLDRVVQQLTAASWSNVRGLIDQGCVQRNRSVCSDPAEPVTAGDQIEVRFEPDRRYRTKNVRKPPPERWFKLVYEDEHLIVVDKPAGLLTVPTAGHEPHTLIGVVGHYLTQGAPFPPRLEVVQRLDREVSGLLVIGKHREAGQRLQQQFAAHEADRQYVAIVAGVIDRTHGTLDTYLSTNDALQQIVSQDPSQGERAITHYTVEAILHKATLVRVRLETGRRNQVRVQFAWIGHPVVGDTRYWPKRARHQQWPYPRLALHAETLGFIHPMTGAQLRFESAWPPEFRKFMRAAPLQPPKPAAAPVDTAAAPNTAAAKTAALPEAGPPTPGTP